MDASGREIFERFLDEVIEWVRDHQPLEFERAGEVQVRSLTARVVERCRSYGTIRAVHVFEFVRVQLLLGEAFDREPWAIEVMRQEVTPGRRMSALLAEAELRTQRFVH